jgi:putative membrane protein
MNKTVKILLYFLIAMMTIGILIRFFLPSSFLGLYDGYNYHMLRGGMFPLGVMGMGVFWLVIILVAIQWFGNSSFKERHIDSLKRRLSKGEISIEEYEELKEKMKD